MVLWGMAKRIDYIANIRLPTEKAHGAQIIKMCEALSMAGADVRLLVSNRATPITEDAFTYYGVATAFPIERIKVPNTVQYGMPGFVIQSLFFAIRSLRKIRRDALLYSRDDIVLGLLSYVTRQPIVWESHIGSWNFFSRRLVRRALRIVVISEGIRDLYLRNGVDPHKLVVAHDGIDLTTFMRAETKEVARARLGLPQDKRIVMYVGRVDGWKGTSTLLEASKHLNSTTLVVIVGGEPHQVEALRKVFPRVLFVGYRPYRELADNLAAADVVVLPNTAQDKISSHFTSPLKLFGYMASGKPMVATDLPSLREVVPETEAYIVAPDSPIALAAGIRDALVDASGSARRAQAALTRVDKYTWDMRAKTILNALSHEY
ncbi:MAG: hypothetical protein JWN18_217 [Parcubacteria group bacterium]|nr:hypothetical protein [Parcubacteria group bacterium]